MRILEGPFAGVLDYLRPSDPRQAGRWWGDLYNRRAKKRGGQEGNVNASKRIRQVDGIVSSETAEAIAQEIELSPRTVERAGECLM